MSGYEARMEKLAAIRRTLEATTTDLAKTPCCRTDTERGAPSCMFAEEMRALSREEKKRGWARRPFDAYCDANLCSSCSAYWHASVAVLRVLDVQRWSQIVEQERVAKQKP